MKPAINVLMVATGWLAAAVGMGLLAKVYWLALTFGWSLV
jgi:hypothetical protein